MISTYSPEIAECMHLTREPGREQEVAESPVENMEIEVQMQEAMSGSRSVTVDQQEEEIIPAWESLPEDALAEVFRRVPFEDRLVTVPMVCKRWRDASFIPDNWRHVDMQGWFHRRAERDYLWEFESEATVEYLIMKCVDLSDGQLRELRSSHCSDDAIDYVATRCASLQVLSIPNSLSATDQSIKKLAVNCPSLQELDVSDCYNISDQALEAVGRNCPSMIWLGRNMLQKKLSMPQSASDGRHAVPGGDDEAIVVAKHMVNLQHLEMKRTQLSDKGLAHLARGCGRLTTLNLACCMELSEHAIARVSEKCPNILEFTKPITPRMHVASDRLRLLFG